MVDIYVKTSAKGPGKRKKAYYVWVIQMKLKGKEYTRKGFGELKDATENQATLTAIITALQRFTKDSEIRINTSCEHVLNSARNFWPPQWEKAGWVKNNGKPVANSELWQQFLNVSRMHTISWNDKEHEFSSWMEYELKHIQELNKQEG